MKRENLEKVIRRKLELWGYNEVRIPILYEDIWGEKNLIYFEKNGKFLALRPEITREILKSIRYEETPKRMFYMGPIFKFNGGQVEENYQIGWELVYRPSVWRDLEVLLIVKEIFDELNIEDYIIELGNTRIWEPIWKLIEDKERIKVLKGYLKKRDYVSFLENLEITSEIRNEVINLLYYDSSINFVNPLIEEGLKLLLSFIENLIKLGFKESNIVMNPALMRPYEYYDGIIFEVYLKNAKLALGGGGSYIEKNKYNELLYGFGFAFVEENLLGLVNKNMPEESAKYFMGFDDDFIRIYEDMKREREKGIVSIFIPNN
ncbi:ATP phosphoribosyltransferase regulatory subunit [Dictyoglomus thermophilum]|uniref:Histidine--tRNA ligase n=1 Tax=Dictyoglomus thermophilum TaxID=14 RepID=A0A7C2CM89_DICTH|nr:ATP phosphoribosyltransferase regulatory subunit [Dictyoglomus thermophilum]TYT22451.1 ATP phosphoribosyltransferase regulatory subunit [Dictyoglomus thermophilum]